VSTGASAALPDSLRYDKRISGGSSVARVIDPKRGDVYEVDAAVGVEVGAGPARLRNARAHPEMTGVRCFLGVAGLAYWHRRALGVSSFVTVLLGSGVMIRRRGTQLVFACVLGATCLQAGCAMFPRLGGECSCKIPEYDARTFYETTSVFGGSFSHDESRILLTTDATGVFNVYGQPIAGGDPVALTHSTTDSVFGVGYFPKDDRILYSSDQGGNEQNHLYVLEPGGKPKDLTPGENLKASFAGWSRDHKTFWVLTNERDPRHFDLYRYATDGYARQLVFENTEGWRISEVSPDGRWVALVKVRTNADNDIYIWDASEPETAPKHVTPHEGDVSHSVQTFTRDSRELYYGTNEHGEFTQVWLYDLSTGVRKPIVKADWDVWYVYFSEDGRYRVTGINEDARTVVTVQDTKTGRPLELPDLPEGDITGVSISRSETKMAFYVNGDTSPSNLHVLDLRTGKYRQLTDTLNPAIRREYLVEGHVVRYESFDGLQIPAVLYRPHCASPRNKVPALVSVHGGPGGQARHGYRAMTQHLINHGYAVLAVNNRGSTGYGKTFYHMDDKRHGDVDLKDCIWGRRYLEGLDWVDGSRVGIIGGSYGGYMVAAALAFEPEAFDVGVDIFGVTNWLRTLTSIPPWWESFRESLYAEMGDPEKEEERLRGNSPLFHASNIVKPMLVVQGANDPRVLQAESDEIVEAVRKNGVPVEYIVFPDEGHGFRKKANRITASDAYVRFLDQYLKGTSD
jgi:dipeptidyl aminopeptidase/acylaminoacyl peptidase